MEYVYLTDNDYLTYLNGRLYNIHNCKNYRKQVTLINKVICYKKSNDPLFSLKDFNSDEIELLSEKTNLDICII